MPSLGFKIKRIGSRKRDSNSPRASLSASSSQTSSLNGEPTLDRPSERSPAPTTQAPHFASSGAAQPAPLKTAPASASSDSIDAPPPQSPLDRTTPEQPLEIKTGGGKTFVFKPKSAGAASSQPASPRVGGNTPARKHTQFFEPSKPLERSASLAQIARDKKNSSLNDTRHFYAGTSVLSTEHAARPSLSRKTSYADDRRALEYMSKKGTAEGSNLIFRTGSRIWDANKESGLFGLDATSRISSGRPSRRASAAGSVAGSVDSDDVDEDSDDQMELHPGRFMSPANYDEEDDEQPEFADSYLIRAADWLLGIPHDSPMTLRNSLKKRPKKLSLEEKRRYREATVTDDPAFLLAAYLSLKELM